MEEKTKGTPNPLSPNIGAELSRSGLSEATKAPIRKDDPTRSPMRAEDLKKGPVRVNVTHVETSEAIADEPPKKGGGFKIDVVEDYDDMDVLSDIFYGSENPDTYRADVVNSDKSHQIGDTPKPHLDKKNTDHADFVRTSDVPLSKPKAPRTSISITSESNQNSDSIPEPNPVPESSPIIDSDSMPEPILDSNPGSEPMEMPDYGPVSEPELITEIDTEFSSDVAPDMGAAANSDDSSNPEQLANAETETEVEPVLGADLYSRDETDSVASVPSEENATPSENFDSNAVTDVAEDVEPVNTESISNQARNTGPANQMKRPLDPMLVASAPVAGMPNTGTVTGVAESGIPDPATAKPERPTNGPAPIQPMGVITDLGQTSASSSGQDTQDPLSRPMEQMPVIEPPKPKSHKGLMIAIIISAFIAIGCGVAALLLFINKKPSDPVATAMEKIATEGLPQNFKISGQANLAIENQSLPVSGMQIDLESTGVFDSMINNTSANITINLADKKPQLEVNEIYTPGGGIFLRVDGIGYLLDDLTAVTMTNTDNNNSGDTGNIDSTQVDETNCLGSPDENCAPPESIDSSDTEADDLMTLDEIESEITAQILQISEVMDGEWMRISTDELSSMYSPVSEQDESICLTQFFIEAKNDKNILSSAYLNHPFIFSTDENIPIASKENDVREILISDQNLRDFLTEANSSTALTNLAKCINRNNSPTLNVDAMVTKIKQLPKIYAEVNDDHDFTRLFFATSWNDESNCSCPEGAQCLRACPEPGEYKLDVDLNISYPENVNVPEPTNYKDFSDTMMNLFEGPDEYAPTVGPEMQPEPVETP